MKTIIVKPTPRVIKKAVKLLLAGEIVAFPTETVYGLGANALDVNAINKIFAVKNRPNDNPLIVHVSSINQASLLVKEISPSAKILMDNFWPGPLTLVIKKSSIVSNSVTAGLDSVAIRMPSNKIALELIKKAKVPLAAPSANSSTKPSPTRAEHVFEDLNKKIPLIIDGGICDIGIESTVIDMTKKPFTILRPGNITKEQIEEVLCGKVIVHSINKNQVKAKAPGMKYKHYSPKAKVILFKTKNDLLSNSAVNYAIIGLNCNGIVGNKLIYSFDSVEEYIKNIFSTFRLIDKLGIKTVYVQTVKEKGKGLALMNRLKKAASVILV